MRRQPGYCTSVLRSRRGFDRLSDLTQQLTEYAGLPRPGQAGPWPAACHAILRPGIGSVD
jgi:hypothetical protein